MIKISRLFMKQNR